MTRSQFLMIKRLALCTFYPGSWDKAFVRNLAARPEDYELSENQADWVVRLTYKYRRQLAQIRQYREELHTTVDDERITQGLPRLPFQLKLF